MILQALHQLYDRLIDEQEYDLAPPGFSVQKISFKIVLHEDGRLFNFQTVDPKNQTRVLGNGKPSGSGINPCFLWDNQTYLLGRQSEEKKIGFGQVRFEAFRKRHLEVEREIGCPSFTAVCRFLKTWDPERILDFELLNEVGTGFGVFQIIGKRGYVHDDPEILKWWNDNIPCEGEVVTGQCLLTGKMGVSLARLHPKIKGIAGAQSAGASLVSFNDSAYESYGRSQSFNSPVSESAATKYGTALNALLTGPVSNKHRLRIGDTTCVFWTERKTVLEDVFAELLGSGSSAAFESQDQNKLASIERLLEAVRCGGNFQITQDLSAGTPFFLLGLAPNAARLSVRFFFRSTVENLLSNLHNHHNCMKIVREFEKGNGKRLPDPEFPAVWQLLLQTARVSDEIPPLLGGALTRAIIEGTNYPEGLFGAVIRRIRADRRVNYLKAAILKAILQRNYEITMSTTLDQDHPSKGYQLGRLFAVFEQSQRQAHEFKLERTIRETFYSAASANPLSVFSRLHRLHIHHLRKLSGGSQKYFEDWVSEIEQKFQSTSNQPASYPTSLPLKEQALFSIGYYHQMHAMKHKENN